MRSRLCGLLEVLEPDRQPVAIRTILTPPRSIDKRSGNRFETEFEERTIVDFEQPVRDMDAEIRVYPDQMGVECRMVDFRQRQPIRGRPAVLTARPRP